MIQVLKGDPTLPKKHSTAPPFLIGVRTEDSFKSKLHDPGKQNFRVGTQVIVESHSGAQTGIIASNKIPNTNKAEYIVPRILRTFNQNDLQAQIRRRQTEQRAKELCLQIINKLKLKMHLSRVHQPLTREENSLLLYR